MMKVLVTAKNGQLGYQLQQTQPSSVNASVNALAAVEADETDEALDVTYVDRQQLDLSNPQQIQQLVAELKPDVIINAAAYTAVDQAESDSEAAFAVNATGVEQLALAAKQLNNGCVLLHVSTDYVFAGDKNQALRPDEPVNPINQYGASKLKGEQLLAQILPDQHIIVRTSWVYGEHGNNFVKTMLRLMNERSSLKIVNDQFGAPTYAKNLARCLWQMALQTQALTADKQPAKAGIYHFSDQANISWFDFANEIYQQGKQLGLIDNEVSLAAVDSSQFVTPAKRPSFSLLDCSSSQQQFAVQQQPWQQALTAMLTMLKAQS